MKLRSIKKKLNEKPMFPCDIWCSSEKYALAGIEGYEPMTAKELDTQEKQDNAFNNPDNFIEEKFDGTRALVYFFFNTNIEKGYCRVFSRRISKKTGFYVENTDSVPQIRDINSPLDLAGTILDGEMFIPNQDFEASCSVLNCKYNKAIERQKEIGFEVFHAFDILFYKGMDVRNMPLEKRKEYLQKAVEEVNSPFIKLVNFYSCGELIKKKIDQTIINSLKGNYPELMKCLNKSMNVHGFVNLTPKGYYEYIVAKGGEGVIIKSKNGKYLHKRGWEYSKIKKFLTRELVIVGYEEPELNYKGKFPDPLKWDYWCDKNYNKYDLSSLAKEERDKWIYKVWSKELFIPISKYYYYNWIGNLLLGVFIPEEMVELKQVEIKGEFVNTKLGTFLVVCSCAGFDEETRQYITANKEKLLGSVVEVKAQEVFKDSGRLRHPRFLRFRPDKNARKCTWEDHIS